MRLVAVFVLSLALFFLGWASTAHAVIPASERQVLLDLYASTNGANWTKYRVVWNGPAGTECMWNDGPPGIGTGGVWCDGTQSHVTGISLPSNNLVGSLPSLGGLTALQSFNVSQNQLTGSIPSLSGMTALQGFYAKDNQLTGTIPALSGLPALQQLALQGNQLTGSIPSLSGLPALQTFYVNNNLLSGPVPPAPASLAAGGSNLCGNSLGSGGNPSIDAAWVTAQDTSVAHGGVAGGDWLACQIGAVSVSLTVTKSGTGSGTVSSNPAGINCGATCSGNFSSGAKLALTASPASGSTFAGWSGACTGTGICTVTMDAAKSVSAAFKIAPFAAIKNVSITANRATITTVITFNAPDQGKSGQVFVTAWVHVNALGTLGISSALNSQLSVTSTDDDPARAGAGNPLHLRQETLAATDPNAFVLVQSVGGNWQLVVGGQLLPYASGVLGDALAAQTILSNTDATNLSGSQYCLGYGSSAADMIAAGNVQVVAVIPDPSATTAATGTCLPTALPVFRFFNNNAGGHFYTINAAEKDTVIANYAWFRYEGTGFNAAPAAQSGLLPVYRFFNNNAGGHFYTINEAEKDTVIANYGWFRYEGTGFHASPDQQPGMLPVYRFFNNNAGGHFYTINEAEKDTVIANYNWFRYEGVGFYAYPAQ